MKIYVGRWDLLPENLEGYNGLSQMSRIDVALELSREIDQWAESNPREDNTMGVYTPREFEDTINQDINNTFRTDIYWVRIFE